MGVPSIHSVVRTWRAVSGQLTAGRRKFGSSAVALAISEMAEASMRRSSSSFMECSSISTAATGRKRCASREKRSIIRAAKKKLERSSAKRFSTPGRRILTATFSSFVRPCEPAQWMRRQPVTKLLTALQRSDRCADGLARFRHAERRQAVLQGFQFKGPLGADHVQGGWRGIAQA